VARVQNGTGGASILLFSGHGVSFKGLKRPERSVAHPHPSSAGVKGTVELYRYPPPPHAFMVCYMVKFTVPLNNSAGILSQGGTVQQGMQLFEQKFKHLRNHQQFDHTK
jgi:hypothetical protein